MCAYLCAGGVEGGGGVHTCVLGVLRGVSTYLWVCTGGIEGYVYIPMDVRWGC